MSYGTEMWSLMKASWGSSKSLREWQRGLFLEFIWGITSEMRVTLRTRSRNDYTGVPGGLTDHWHRTQRWRWALCQQITLKKYFHCFFIRVISKSQIVSFLKWTKYADTTGSVVGSFYCTTRPVPSYVIVKMHSPQNYQIYFLHNNNTKQITKSRRVS